MNEPIFIKPSFTSYLWGGQRLAADFCYAIPEGNIGEAWLFSVHPDGDSYIESGKWTGQSLRELWEIKPNLFGPENNEKQPPLLVKILDAREDLAIQVHPNDAYAEANNLGIGKAECWYIIDAKENAQIFYGHSAKNREELAKQIKEERWGELLEEVTVKAGDFIYVPPGTIHALGKGILALEVQQSSNITYRMYDFDRKDENGNVRNLHIKEGLEVIEVPSQQPDIKHVSENSNDEIVSLIENDFFDAYRWKIVKNLDVSINDSYSFVTVIAGQGEMMIGKEKYALKKGDCFMLPRDNYEINIQGQLELIACSNGALKE